LRYQDTFIGISFEKQGFSGLSGVRECLTSTPLAPIHRPTPPPVRWRLVLFSQRSEGCPR
jgi:hypothetical protein